MIHHLKYFGGFWVFGLIFFIGLMYLMGEDWWILLLIYAFVFSLAGWISWGLTRHIKK
jgi:hypothetical protein